MSTLALRFAKKAGEREIAVEAPLGGVTRLYLPSDQSRAALVAAVLRAKCEPGESLELLGEEVGKLKHRARERLRRRVAGVTPAVGLMTNLNAWENISLAAAYHGTPPLESVAATTLEVLQAFGVETASFLARLPEELDALERKIAAFVRLLVAAPELALIDGLHDGLNRQERARVARFEAEFRARQPGSTLVFLETREEEDG